MGVKMLLRKGEDEKVWYRTDRCFRVGSEWFIATREEGDIGPFKSRQAAERSVPNFVKVMKEAKDSSPFARRLAIEGIWAATHYV